MILLFPCEPFSPRRIDPDFVAEYEAAKLIGFPCFSYSHKEVESGDIESGLRMLPFAGDDPVIVIRGRMLTGEIYAKLHAGLIAKGYLPVTAPEAYDEAHYLPLAYRITHQDTARSAWMEGDDEDSAWRLYQGFFQNDAIIKDWVKSAKALWREACFIPARTPRERFGEIFRAFRRERGKLFNRGVSCGNSCLSSNAAAILAATLWLRRRGCSSGRTTASLPGILPARWTRSNAGPPSPDVSSPLS